MRVVVCEDEKIFANTLCIEIASFFEERKIDVEIVWYDNGNLLLNDFANNIEPDLVFMDIELGDADGVEIIRRVRKQNLSVPVIFLTAMEGRVLDGYDVRALYFLYKRDYKERLYSVLERYVKDYINTSRIKVKGKDSINLFKVQEICWVESEGRGAKIHTDTGSYVDAESIHGFIKQLPEEFFIEVYHCLYVNVDRIGRVDSDSILLDTGETIPVSRRKRKDVMSAVMKRLVAE